MGEVDPRSLGDRTVARIIAEVNKLDLPDGAYWAMIAERVGMQIWEVQEMVASDPEFFGWRTLGEDPTP
jgi:cytidylate kinase